MTSPEGLSLLIIAAAWGWFNRSSPRDPRNLLNRLNLPVRRRSSPSRFQLAAGLRFDLRVQAVAVRVHRDDRREIADVEVPHGFGRAELEQRDVDHALDAAGVELRRAADGVEVDRRPTPSIQRAFSRPCRPCR